MAVSGGRTKFGTGGSSYRGRQRIRDVISKVIRGGGTTTETK